MDLKLHVNLPPSQDGRKEVFDPSRTHVFVLEDGDKITLPTPALSPTQVSMYLKCPKQYYFRYVLGQKTPPSVALKEGESHHAALEAQNLHRRETKENLPTKQVVEIFEDTFSTVSKEIETWEESKDAVLDRGRELLTLYMTKKADKIEPLEIESQHTILMRGVPVTLVIDVLTTKQEVIDYKVLKSTSPMHRQRNSLWKKDLQLHTYALATGAKKIGWQQLLKDKVQLAEGGGKPQPHVLTAVPFLVESVARAISAGVFPETALDHWACSEKWCGYWSSCRGRPYR